ncbi:unnamed protein product [Anisakis simplex]|uniref:Transthyretin-like family protein n=1 Tax=Anisakis simplex TaxID=6269 RepID=A0A0M3J0L5_ANISI|nr:unnamed protein product [Anisakis simplex]
MTYRLVLVLLAVAILPSLAVLRDQSIAVTGQLKCGKAPAARVRVKLWDDDEGPDPDDLLDQGYTDADGKFSLSGGTAELTPIDPVFKVYHDCDDSIKPGHRKVRFILPQSYITNDRVPKKTFNIGVINLETIFAKESREMLLSRMMRNPNFDRYHSLESEMDTWIDQ